MQKTGAKAETHYDFEEDDMAQRAGVTFGQGGSRWRRTAGGRCFRDGRRVPRAEFDEARGKRYGELGAPLQGRGLRARGHGHDADRAAVRVPAGRERLPLLGRGRRDAPRRWRVWDRGSALPPVVVLARSCDCALHQARRIQPGVCAVQPIGEE